MNERNPSNVPQPLVSVLMAVYNTGDYLSLAIESIFNQTYQHFELIIVNDGSTDNSDAIISAYQDDRIIYLKNEVNLGVVKSRIRGLEKVRGKYLAVMDSDDIAMPDRLERQVDFLEEHIEFGLCGTYFNVIDSNGEFVESIKFPEEDADIRAFLHFGNCFCHSTVVYRAELAQRFGFSNANFLGEDYQLIIDVASVSKLTNLPFLGCLYRVHEKNVSFKNNLQMFNSIREINRQNLLKLGIPFSEKLLDVHSHFLVFDAAYFADQSNFEALESWLKTIIAATEQNPMMNRPVIFKFLLHRWFVICYKRKSIYKILFSDLLFTYKIKYLTLMIGEAYERGANKYIRKLSRVALFSLK